MKEKSAFTLVELSIVLVILGLLVGGVLSGQALIRASELRSVAKEKDQYITALNAFRDKYFALPGDMKNAFAFWGTDCGTDTADASVGCNGNGDGRIYFSVDNGELLKTWEHLSRAGLIEGSYDGVGIAEGNSADGVDGLTENNIPVSKFPGGSWTMNSDVMNAVGNPTNNVILHLGRISPAGHNVQTAMTTLAVGEAWNIDTKVDDGRANTGSLRGDGNGDNCQDTGTDYYSIEAAGGPDVIGECILHFLL